MHLCEHTLGDTIQAGKKLGLRIIPGVELSAAKVEALAGGDVIGRPHFAQAMIRQGYVSTNREAFDCYLDTKEYHQKIERGKPSVQEYITAIKNLWRQGVTGSSVPNWDQ